MQTSNAAQTLASEAAPDRALAPSGTRGSVPPFASASPDASTSETQPVLQNANFRWLLAGGGITMLGDQFTLIALPWLVLMMTGDTRVLGTVLALVSVPRAVFILVGGAVVDRHSPYRVLMVTKLVNMVLLGALAALVFSGTLTLPLVYALALGIGVASAFSIPAGTSLLPSVVAPQQLGAANGIMLGLRQFSMFIGPLVAGLLIAVFGDGGSGRVADARGIAIAFALDAASFALSAWTQSRIRMRSMPSTGSPQSVGVLSSVVQGLAHIGRDAQLRTCFLYWAALAVFIMGPLHIALPVLASTHAAMGPSALGLIVGAHGAGTLAGMVASGAGGRVRLGTLGMTVLAADALVGLLFMPMGQVASAWQAAGLMFAIGVLGGFLQVSIFTWMQRRVPAAMMGRTMSLFMFIFMGLVPIASAATGWLMHGVTLSHLFMGCGAALLGLTVLVALLTPMRHVRDAQAPREARA